MRATKKKLKRKRRRARQKQQAIRFSPRAWAKLCYLRDIGQTEIGGFGISAKDDLLLVKDVQLVKQTCDWAVMFILAKTGATYARLQFRAGPGGSLVLPVEVDYSRSFEAAEHEAWKSEYEQSVCDTSLFDPIDMELLDPWSEYDAFRWNLTDTKEAQFAINE